MKLFEKVSEPIKRIIPVMPGMYIHIPFCRKICSYCDFYKTTLVRLLPDYIRALNKELEEKKNYLDGESLETIYLGGGTPSLLEIGQIAGLFDNIRQYYKIDADCEMTLEANPDDLTPAYLRSLHEHTPINRLSIGIQSFGVDDLVLLNRRHTSRQAIECIENARQAEFTNITIDLIYGLPGMTVTSWEKNLDIAFSHEIQHLSAYHLTLEPHTALSRMASRGQIQMPRDEESFLQFMLLNKMAREKGFFHYEISNLAREGFMSKHNSNYWLQKKYIGLGPSAHSYNLVSRQWNISNVNKYIESVSTGSVYYESELLDAKTKFNEYLMLSLRTAWGINLTRILKEFGDLYLSEIEKNIRPFLSSALMIRQDDSLKLTPEGWMVSDYIIGRLIQVHAL